MQRRLFMTSVAACSLAAHAGGALVLRFSVLMSNPGAQALHGQRLWMYLPVAQGQHGRVTRQDVDAPHSFVTDRLGHNILELQPGMVPAHGRRIARITVELEAGADVQSRAQPQTQWLAPQVNIESDHPDLVAAATPLRQGTPQATARSVFDWVAASLTYAGYLGEDLGALRALQTRRGDCTEYAALVVALCRACGVPARMVGGYFTQRSLAPRPTDYHNWAEIWLDGRWRVADAQLRHWQTLEQHYIPFRYYWDSEINPVGLAHRYRVAGEMQVSM
ncbi:MAG: transglutaminase family protein [Ramlibacter sp.]